MRLVDADVAKNLLDKEIYWDDSRKASVRAFLHSLPTVDAVEVSRLGKLGRLMMQYNGCPRGTIGTRGGDGTAVKIIELEAITDVDGNRWVPVLAEDLEILKSSAETAHGRWLPIPEHENKRCSVCRTVFSDFTLGYYCPRCGAKMDGGDQNE